MVVTLALHLLLNARVGGTPLLVSIWNVKFRPNDAPRLWPEHALSWWQKAKRRSWPQLFYALSRLPHLEVAILSTIVVAWAIALFKEFVFVYV